MYKHILIPTDGSERSERAVREGIALAGATHARVTLLTVSMPYTVAAEEPLKISDTPARYAASERKLATRRLQPGEDLARSTGVAATKKHVFAKHPFEAIIDTAAGEGCDLIFMASRGNIGGLAGLLIGSETQKVLTHTKTPVLVCH
jgi:nucleotide-binding universal stress UspA family protein